MKIKLNTGLSVRTGPDNEDGTVPTRRIGEKGDIVELANIPEWDGEVPEWLLEAGDVEAVDSTPLEDGEE